MPTTSSLVEHEADARRFWEVMRERLQEFSLSLNSEKTRLIEFGRHAVDRRARRGLGKPETFKFLGFTHICGQSRRGKFLLKRRSVRFRSRSASVGVDLLGMAFFALKSNLVRRIYALARPRIPSSLNSGAWKNGA